MNGLTHNDKKEKDMMRRSRLSSERIPPNRVNNEKASKKDNTPRRSTPSPLWQLPRDLLHCLYSEWLASWRDLAALDVACLGQITGDREEWLSSLREVNMTRGLGRTLSDQAMRGWYGWVGSRKVWLVEGFPVRLPVVLDEGIVGLDDYYPRLRSVEIERNIYMPTSSPLAMKAVEEMLTVFLGQCCRLEGVRVDGRCQGGIVGDAEVDAAYLSALTRTIEANALVKMEICFYQPAPSFHLLTNLLVNHISSLKEIEVIATLPVVWLASDLLAFLHRNEFCLRRLSLAGEFDWPVSTLLDYLYDCGTAVEVLHLGHNWRPCDIAFSEELLVSIASACPKLKRMSAKLLLHVDREHAVIRPSALHALCPGLKSLQVSTVSAGFSLEVDDEKREVCFFDNYSMTREERVAWLQFLGDILTTSSHYRLTVADYREAFFSWGDEEWWEFVKSALSPCWIGLQVTLSEQAVLMDALPSLPNLEKLELRLVTQNYSDTMLTAITEYGANLKCICIVSFGAEPRCSFTDAVMAQMIRSSERLECLTLGGLGYDSVLAVTEHSRLRIVDLVVIKGIQSALKALLMGDNNGEKERKKKASVALVKGLITGKGYSFRYLPQDGGWKFEK